MKRTYSTRFLAISIFAVSLAVAGVFGRTNALIAKDKTLSVDSNDVTLRLYQLLDDSHDGKLTDFYVLADVFKDPGKPDEELQHVLFVDYDKNRNYGKLKLHVRCLSKLAPDQLKTYTPKQIYDFGAEDTEKFVKSDAGQLGRTGDMYLRATADRPPASTPVTDEARKQYEFYLTQYVIPALQKK
jgi:hypothetical protein